MNMKKQIFLNFPLGKKAILFLGLVAILSSFIFAGTFIDNSAANWTQGTFNQTQVVGDNVTLNSTACASGHTDNGDGTCTALLNDVDAITGELMNKNQTVLKND